MSMDYVVKVMDSDGLVGYVDNRACFRTKPFYFGTLGAACEMAVEFQDELDFSGWDDGSTYTDVVEVGED